MNSYIISETLLRELLWQSFNKKGTEYFKKLIKSSEPIYEIARGVLELDEEHRLYPWTSHDIDLKIYNFLEDKPIKTKYKIYIQIVKE